MKHNKITDFKVFSEPENNKKVLTDVRKKLTEAEIAAKNNQIICSNNISSFDRSNSKNRKRRNKYSFTKLKEFNRTIAEDISKIKNIIGRTSILTSEDTAEIRSVSLRIGDHIKIFKKLDVINGKVIRLDSNNLEIINCDGEVESIKISDIKNNKIKIARLK